LAFVRFKIEGQAGVMGLDRHEAARLMNELDRTARQTDDMQAASKIRSGIRMGSEVELNRAEKQAILTCIEDWDPPPIGDRLQLLAQMLRDDLRFF
jgi:hypothetical protein